MNFIFKKPLVSEINGILEEELILQKRNSFLIWLNRFFEGISYKSSDRIIVVTSPIKRYLINKYQISPHKIIVLENGVDTNLFQPRKTNQEYDLIFVGNLASWQGLEYLFRAIPFIKEENEYIKIAILGDGVEKENLENITSELKLEKNVTFIGSKSHDEVPKYINKSKICIAPFVLNDRNKKTGISAFKIYEYASCGKPIITTNLKGVSEFINKNKCGIVVEPNNSKALANAIIKLLENPKLAKQMGENGRKAILNGYSWKNVAERTQKVIEDAVKEHKKK